MPEGFETVDMNDPRQHLAWALGSMPSHTPGGHPVGIPPMVVPAWSEFLHQLGFRHHPEEQTLFPAASPHPEMGWMSPVSWVSREDYDKRQAARAATETLDPAALLAAANPELAARIADMSDVEKREEMARQAAKIPGVLEQIAQIRNAMEGNQ